MNDTIVVFDAVWKKFRRGERHDSLRDLIPAATRAVLGRRNGSELRELEFWAVKNVSFEVKRGEALGIIGPNGAGKSTVLKLLTRILKPTRGTCFVRGKTGALIEVAAGFHPDLTGRENIYLQGAIMGMKRREIAARLDQIIEFAGVAEFVDTPVKRYSSGMNARLGFSIAAHLSPDALIIDEVLSVGDMSFQEKCISRMKKFKREGVAIVFVSHNLQAIAELCDIALYLHSHPIAAGRTPQVLERYVEGLEADHSGSSNYDIDIHAGKLIRPDGETGLTVSPGTTLTLCVQYKGHLEWDDVTLGFEIHRSTDRLCVYDANYTLKELGISHIGGASVCVVTFTFRTNLTRGHYLIECHAFHNPTQKFLGYLSPAATVAIDENRTYAGIADIALSATAQNVSAKTLELGR